MSNEYYIVSEKGDMGPYDMVAIVVKIRNGSLKGNMPLKRIDSQEVRPAQEWPELKEFYTIIRDNSKKDPSNKNPVKKLTLSRALKTGFNFLQQNPFSSIFSGLLVLAVIAVIEVVNWLVPANLYTLCYIVGFLLLHFMLSCYMLLVLRMTRGQPINLEFFVDKIASETFKLLRASLLISFPALVGIYLFISFSDNIIMSLIGLLIIIIPGIYIITIFTFTALLIMEQNYEVWNAMETSRTRVLKSGSDNLGVIFSLYTINFIAGLFMLLPMVITLPITISAITEAYDEHFS